MAFVFVGMLPQTQLLEDDGMAPAVPGLFVAGDIRVKRFWQITTAVADGTIAALSAQAYLRR